VALDDTLAFTVTIENTGDAKGVQTVEFRIGDNAVASRKVTLDVNNSTTIEFDEINVSHFDTGEYEYGFLTNDDNRTVTITFQPAGDDRVVVDRDNDTDSENDSNGSDGNDERDGLPVMTRPASVRLWLSLFRRSYAVHDPSQRVGSLNSG